MSSSFVPLPVSDSSARALNAAREACADPTVQNLASAIAQQWPEQGSTTLLDADFSNGTMFLVLRERWLARCRAGIGVNARLHVVALVPRPYTRDALRSLYAGANLPPDLRTGAQALIEQWPHALPGQHRLSFDAGQVTLTLLFGSPDSTLSKAGFTADGIYWYASAARASVEGGTGGTVGGVIAGRAEGPVGGAGFDSFDLGRRLPQMGRHITAQGWWLCNWQSDALASALRQSAFAVQASLPIGCSPCTLAFRRADVPDRRRVTRSSISTGGRTAVVVGGGIAGAHTAYALALRGWRVTVVAAHAAHEGHVAAAMTPVVASDDNPRARLTRAGALLAQSRWAGLPKGGTQACGTVQLDTEPVRGMALEQVLSTLQFPMGWVRPVGQAEASHLCGVPVARGGAFFSSGHLVRPDALIDALLAHPLIQRRAASIHKIVAGCGLWRAEDKNGKVWAEGDHAILASARHTPDILIASNLADPTVGLLGMHALAGEVTGIRTSLAWPAPRRVLGGDGYFLPADQGMSVAGGTYVRGAETADLTLDGQQSNLRKAAALLGQPFIPTDGESLRPGWSGWRAVVPGRLPAIGAWPDAPGVWLATAYASRGLTWAAMAGEMIGGALEGEPDVIETDLARIISPARLK